MICIALKVVLSLCCVSRAEHYLLIPLHPSFLLLMQIEVSLPYKQKTLAYRTVQQHFSFVAMKNYCKPHYVYS